MNIIPCISIQIRTVVLCITLNKTICNNTCSILVYLLERVMREKSVSDALKQLAKRQAVRQYSARPPLKIETNKWMQPVENTDNSADSGDNVQIDRVTTGTDSVTGRTIRVTVPSHPKKAIQGDRHPGTSVDNRNDGSNRWMDDLECMDNDRITVDNSRTINVRESTQGDTRCRNADQTFFGLVQSELQVTSKPTHTRETLDDKQSKEKSQSSGTSSVRQGASIDNDGPSRIIRIPCGEDTDAISPGDTMDKLGSARQDYNKHMQMLIERLAAHKFSKPGMETVVPKPPARPRSAKRPVSAQRMSR